MDPTLILGSVAYALVSAGTIPIFARRYIRGRSFHMLPTKTSGGAMKFKVTSGPREKLLPAKDVPAMVDAAYEEAAWRSLFWPLTLIAHFSDGAQAKTRKRLIDETAAEELGRYRTALSLLAYRAGQEEEPLMARIAAASNEEELQSCEALLRGESSLTASPAEEPLQLHTSSPDIPTQGLLPPAGHTWTAYSTEIGTQFEKVVVALQDATGHEVGRDSFYSESYADDPDGQVAKAKELQKLILKRLSSTGALAPGVLQVVGAQAPSAGVVPVATPLPLPEPGRRSSRSSSKAIPMSKAYRYGLLAKRNYERTTHD